MFDNDELKANADNITRFLDISRQIESFFIQKRAILVDQRPELILTEEINELKVEIQRKDTLLDKATQKLHTWTGIINDAANGKAPNNNVLSLNPMMPMQPLRLGQPLANMNQMKVSVQSNVNSPIAQTLQHAPSPLMNAPSPMSQIRQQNPSMVGSPMNPQMSMQFNTMPTQGSQNVGGLQGPLAYLERTTSNIGILDNRR